MKKVLNILGIFCSFFIAILLFILEIALGVNLALKNFLSLDSISDGITNINFETILVDENNNETEIGKSFYQSFEKTGLKKEDINEVLKSKELKEILGEYFGSVLLKQVDSETEIVYPTKEQLISFVENNYDFVKDAFKLEEQDSEKIEELIDKNYPEIKKELEAFANEIGGL